jgi:hypothetical protein
VGDILRLEVGALVEQFTCKPNGDRSRVAPVNAIAFLRAGLAQLPIGINAEQLGALRFSEVGKDTVSALDSGLAEYVPDDTGGRPIARPLAESSGEIVLGGVASW